MVAARSWRSTQLRDRFGSGRLPPAAPAKVMASMETLATIRRLWEHALWADTKLLEAVRQSSDVSSELVAEMAHIVGTHELWLARLEGRPPRADVWPAASVDEIDALLNETRESYADYLAALTESMRIPWSRTRTAPGKSSRARSEIFSCTSPSTDSTTAGK